MNGNPDFESPLLAEKHYGNPAVFQVESMLRETRRQRSLPEGLVPEICLLDPDGDIVSRLVDAKRAVPDPHWACYHTVLHRFELRGIPVGIIGCAVGGPFAVLLAEQLFASGCELLVSITSAGQIVPVRNPPYFVLIEKALRDEGTSHHYLPPARYVGMKPELSEWISDVLRPLTPRIEIGASWTTDAPYRETREAIEAASADGVLAETTPGRLLRPHHQLHGRGRGGFRKRGCRRHGGFPPLDRGGCRRLEQAIPRCRAILILEIRKNKTQQRHEHHIQTASFRNPAIRSTCPIRHILHCGPEPHHIPTHCRASGGKRQRFQ
jgi:Phosphorylase superfamily